MPSLKSLIADESHAISAYSKAIPQSSPRVARLLRHIRGEEVEHKKELQAAAKKRNVGSVKNIGKAA